MRPIGEIRREPRDGAPTGNRTQIQGLGRECLILKYPADMSWAELRAHKDAERMKLLAKVAAGELSPAEAQAMVSIPFAPFDIIQEPDPAVFELPEENEED